MRLKFHPEFLAGHYRAVVDALADRARLPIGHAVSLVGALSFLGRMDEAEARFAQLRARGASNSRAVLVSRFFLAMGFTRMSDYRRARKLFALNAKEASGDPMERFYVLQGRVFYCYYTGRFRSALKFAARARKLALRSSDLFARTIATDAYGQCRVVAGEIHPGLRLLDEARGLAKRLGNESVSNSIAVSLELHDAELGLSGPAGLEKLEARFRAVGTEDNYSAANVGLELSRQYVLRGRFQDAFRLLESLAPSIYANQNRRQEITLSLRLAELAYQRGDFFGARHYLRFLDRLLHREADATFELAALGLGRKIALAEAREEEADVLAARGRELARDFGTTRDDNLAVRLAQLPPERENREDRVHCVLQSARMLASLPEKLRPLLEHGLVVEAAVAAGLRPGAVGLAVLPQGLGLLARDAGGVSWQETPLSSLSTKILRRLSEGGTDKARLVENVWGYGYDPLRHDPMVYSALSALRRSLGVAAKWLEVSEDGYRFAAPVAWLAAAEPEEKKTAATSPSGINSEHLPHLNHRQIEILEWLRDRRFLAVGECRIRFDVSEITALRDLDGLRRRGLVVRNGRARATRYSLSETILETRP
jgi:hypothetical protein